MAGLGFKDFQVGEVLTSSDVDGYLMQQTVMRFADSGARGSALGTAPGTAVALAEGMVSYLDDSNALQVYSGTEWQSVGRIVQVVSTAKTDTFTTSSTSYTALTGLSASITPTSASNKVLVIVQLSGANDVGVADSDYRLKRDATAIAIGDAASSRTRASGSMMSNTSSSAPTQITVHLDSPATTSATTYSVDIRSTEPGTSYVNRSKNDNNTAVFPRTHSSITLMEVVS